MGGHLSTGSASKWTHAGGRPGWRRGEARVCPTGRTVIDIFYTSLYMRFPASKYRGDKLQAIGIRVVNCVPALVVSRRIFAEPQATVIECLGGVRIQEDHMDTARHTIHNIDSYRELGIKYVLDEDNYFHLDVVAAIVEKESDEGRKQKA